MRSSSAAPGRLRDSGFQSSVCQFLLAIASASNPGCSGTTLNGAGSSFDNPLFSKAFVEYTKLHASVQVNYRSLGSGAGIQQLTQGTVDFGASDAPLTDEQLAAAENDVVHVPVTLGAVSVSYCQG